MGSKSPWHDRHVRLAANHALDQAAMNQAELKRKILGLNSARLYGLSGAGAAPGGVYRPVPKTVESLIPDSLKMMEFPGFAADNLSRTRKEYLAMGAAPSRTRYGWVRRA